MNEKGGIFDFLSFPERLFSGVTSIFSGDSSTGFFVGLFAAWKIFAAVVSILSLAIIFASVMLAMRHRTVIKTRLNRKERKQTQGEARSTQDAKSKTGIVRPEWDALMKKCARATEQQVVNLILEADAVADEALKRLGIPGEDMGARMKALSGQLDALDEFWSAHKTRNMIAHTPGFHVTLQDLERVLHQYHKALKELGAI